MMGQLNHEHDFLIKKLSELIEAINWLLFLMLLFFTLVLSVTANDGFWENINTNKDGYLDPDEFRSLGGLTNSFISGYFGKFDANEDGLISPDEYNVFVKSDADIYEYSLHWINFILMTADICNIPTAAAQDYLV